MRSYLTTLIILFLSFLINFDNILTKYAFQCGTSGKKVCAVDNTCCYDKSSSDGYKCFPIKDGSCCVVGEKQLLSVCPSDSICNTETNQCSSLG